MAERQTALTEMDEICRKYVSVEVESMPMSIML